MLIVVRATSLSKRFSKSVNGHRQSSTSLSLSVLLQPNDQTKILETMGKLTGLALRWYHGNLQSFFSWDDTENALRNRFKEFTSTSQLLEDLLNTCQQENESVISFYENVIRRYHRAQTTCHGTTSHYSVANGCEKLVKGTINSTRKQS